MTIPRYRPETNGNAHQPPRKDNVGNEHTHMRDVPIDGLIYLKLRKEAARRDSTVPRLIGDLLSAIVEDRLTSAVLDR